MPIYEFQCRDCQAKISIFVKSISSPLDPACSSCSSKNLERLITSFGISKSVASVHEYHTNSNSPDYYMDPRNIGRSTEERFAEMGMEMPSQVREMIDGAREGEMPGAVKDLQPNVGEI